MTDRGAALRSLADHVADRPAVADAWLAKSFTDRLVVLELADGETVPADLRERLRAAGLAPYNGVQDVPVSDAAFAGDVGDASRHRFVDPESRGSLQSSVVELVHDLQHLRYRNKNIGPAPRHGKR